MIDTNKNGVRFHNNALKEMNEEYLGAKEEYNEQQKALVAEIMNIAGRLYTLSNRDIVQETKNTHYKSYKMQYFLI